MGRGGGGGGEVFVSNHANSKNKNKVLTVNLLVSFIAKPLQNYNSSCSIGDYNITKILLLKFLTAWSDRPY